MKRALTVVLFLLFTIGVCVDGNEDSVSVTERDSVTLKSGVTERQTDDGIEWRFDVTRIAKISSDSTEPWVKPDGSFRDRLQLDRQTGDLKISNIRTTDSGEYKVKIKSPRGSPEMTFTVNVVPVDVSAAAVKSVSVLEGDTVTLHTHPTYIKKYDEIQWRFGQQKSPVADLNIDAGIFITSDDPDERFRGRLELDHQSGSLTIKNTRTTDSGDYEVEISNTISSYIIHHTQSFRVTVRDAVKSLSVKKGDSVTLQTNVTEIQKNDLIQWMFEHTVLAKINKTAKQFPTFTGPEGRFRERLKLDHQTGSLTITNIHTTDSGLYEVKIISSRYTINRRIIVTVTDVPESGWSSGFGAGIVVGVCGVLLLAAAAAAAAGVFYYRYKRSKKDIHKKKDASQIPLDNVDPETKENGYDSS